MTTRVVACGGPPCEFQSTRPDAGPGVALCPRVDAATLGLCFKSSDDLRSRSARAGSSDHTSRGSRAPFAVLRPLDDASRRASSSFLWQLAPRRRLEFARNIVGADNEARTEDNYLKFRLGSLKRRRRVGRLPGRVHPRFLARSTLGRASRNIQKKTRVYTARFSTFSSLENTCYQTPLEKNRGFAKP